MAVASSRNLNAVALLAMAEVSGGSLSAVISDDCSCFGDTDDGSLQHLVSVRSRLHGSTGSLVEGRSKMHRDGGARNHS